MNVLILIGSILLLVVGAIYPLLAMVLMVRRMNQPGATPLSATHIGLRLMLIATIPLAGILGGFAGLQPAVWESDFLRYLILVTAALSVAGIGLLAFTPGPGKGDA
jgi:hypothetical protein